MQELHSRPLRDPTLRQFLLALFVLLSLSFLVSDVAHSLSREGLGASTRARVPATTAVADSDWVRRVKVRAWEALDPADARLCAHAQSEIAPRAPPHDPLGPCVKSPGFDTAPTPSWRQLGGRLMEVDCLYSGSRSARHLFPTLPSPNASIYLVFAQASPPSEGAEARRVRLALAGNTLRRLRAQFGARIEISLVELFEPPREGLDEVYGEGTINSAIVSTQAVGQDWAMYQEGINSIWHRLEQFEWIIVMNDVMAGPVAHFPAVLDRAAESGAGLYLASNWGGCCMRGFLIGFHARLVSTAKWRRFWQRAQFPCGKFGPMFVGEAQLSLPPLSWGDSCATSTQHPLSKTDDLGTMLHTRSPFLYRRGLAAAFTSVEGGGIEGRNGSAVTDVDTMLAFVNELKVEPHVEACGSYTIFTK